MIADRMFRACLDGVAVFGVLLALFGAVGALNASAASIEIEDVSRDEVMDAAFDIMQRDGWRLVDDGRRLMVFEKEPSGVGGFMADVLFGSRYDSSTMMRASFSASGRGAITTLTLHYALVTNPGSAFERPKQVADEQAQERIGVIKNVAEGRPHWGSLWFSSFKPSNDDSVGVKENDADGMRYCSTSQKWVSSEEGDVNVFYACAPSGVSGECLGFAMIAYDTPCHECAHKLRIGKKRIRRARFDQWSTTLFSDSGKNHLFNALRGASPNDILTIERTDKLRKVKVVYDVPIGHLSPEISAVKIECNNADLR